MSSKKRPRARRSKQPRATRNRSTVVNIPHKRRKGPSSDRAFEAKQRAFHAIARMRHDGILPSDAVSEEGTTIATIKKYLPATLRKSRTGRWVVTKSDSYLRLLSLPGPHGPVTVRVHGYKEAQFASAYVASVKRWRKTRKSYELAPFHGKKVGDFQLLTASRTLAALDDAGLLQLDTLYAALKDTV